MTGDALLARVIAGLRDTWSRATPDPTTPHRVLQNAAEAACYWLLLTDAGVDDRAHAAGVAKAAVDALALQQDPATGLFLVGDNGLSPPDSGFTINGLARLVEVLRNAAGGPVPEGLHTQVRQVITAALPSLRTGGVHTPNHRWELASALVRSGVLLEDAAALARADEWLAEGIDVQPDGLYSERSPLYATHVTNPALLAIAHHLGRPALVDVVHRNLHAHALLTDADGQVCTLQSRRQDQARPFSVADFEHDYRAVAHLTGCATCRAMGEFAGSLGGSNAVPLAAGLLLGLLEVGDGVGDRPEPGPGWHDFTASHLVVHHAPDGGRLVVRAAPDVAVHRRVASGLNHCPDVVALRTGGLSVEGIRLTRRFFGLGPFRATSLDREGDSVVLRETASAAYYQPIPAGERREEGDYVVGFEGRFAAAMDFDARPRDDVVMATQISVHLAEDAIGLVVATEGPAVPLALEISFGTRPVGVAGQCTAVDDRSWRLRGVTRLRVAEDESWSFLPAGAALLDSDFYEPGEAWRYLGGTDRRDGPRLLVSWMAGTPFELVIRRDRQPADRR